MFFGKTFALFTSLDPNLRAPLAIALGAIPGALSRYYLGLLCLRLWGESFPYGTFVVNITGSLLMGFLVTLALERSLISPDLRLALAVGFLGSYTTFSTYALDMDLMLKTNRQAMMLFYGLGSLVLGVIGVEIGSFLARKLP
ncbi:MAG: fluoride efflux transporter CrcB [Snowella sp.]|nr:fluoride efflux transporter CrcB [Snowella sp.]